ncbi:unnamed protein product, partial [Thelazia callipaeda]|uniref:LORF2 protein n=1 Tax=Thelazia callipaeda TaxID=103827 RepID=A0A0N5CRZ0_THECL
IPDLFKPTTESTEITESLEKIEVRRNRDTEDETSTSTQSPEAEVSTTSATHEETVAPTTTSLWSSIEECATSITASSWSPVEEDAKSTTVSPKVHEEGVTVTQESEATSTTALPVNPKTLETFDLSIPDLIKKQWDWWLRWSENCMTDFMEMWYAWNSEMGYQ